MTAQTSQRQGSGLLGPILLFTAAVFVITTLPLIGMVGPAASDEPDVPSTGLYWPVEGTISDGFGWRLAPDKTEPTPESHTGIDIAAPTGTPIYAAAAGRVVFAGKNGNYGLMVRIQHTSRTETWYGHMDVIKASVGQRVAAGQMIGLVGSTGRSTGPHVHFEYRVDGEPVDPDTLYH